MGDQIHLVCPHCSTVNRVAQTKLGAGAKCGKCKKSLFTGHPVELNKATFEKNITRNDIPVVVDFWAPWCGPCKMMAPAYELATTQLEPQFRLAKLNTEQVQTIAAQYNIRSIPTLGIFRHGREIARQAGAMDAGSIVRWAQMHSH